MLELADVFEQYGPAYLKKYGERMPTRHKKVMHDVMRCLTPELGGQIYECEPCHQIAYSYHSCQPVPSWRGIGIVPNAGTTTRGISCHFGWSRIRPKEAPMVPESPRLARGFQYPPIIGTGMTKASVVIKCLVE